MKKSTWYIEWKNEIRKEKMIIAGFMITMCLATLLVYL